jgi:hypothetical protein
MELTTARGICTPKRIPGVVWVFKRDLKWDLYKDWLKPVIEFWRNKSCVILEHTDAKRNTIFVINFQVERKSADLHYLKEIVSLLFTFILEDFNRFAKLLFCCISLPGLRPIECL